MKAKQIRFFTPDENSEVKKEKKKAAVKSAPVSGYISTAGKVVFPDKSASQLGFSAETNRFKVGTLDGKRKIKSLFLIPDSGESAETFELVKAAKSHSISLPIILQKGGIDFAETKYTFLVKPFDYSDDVVGYELKLATDAPKPEYTGKPRGRKRQTPIAE